MMLLVDHENAILKTNSCELLQWLIPNLAGMELTNARVDLRRTPPCGPCCVEFLYGPS